MVWDTAPSRNREEVDKWTNWLNLDILLLLSDLEYYDMGGSKSSGMQKILLPYIWEWNTDRGGISNGLQAIAEACNWQLQVTNAGAGPPVPIWLSVMTLLIISGIALCGIMQSSRSVSLMDKPRIFSYRCSRRNIRNIAFLFLLSQMIPTTTSNFQEFPSTLKVGQTFCVKVINSTVIKL